MVTRSYDEFVVAIIEVVMDGKITRIRAILLIGDIARMLLTSASVAEPLAGFTIAVVTRDARDGHVDALRAHGARMSIVRIPADGMADATCAVRACHAGLRRSIDRVIGAEVDAVLLAGRLAVAGMLALADTERRLGLLVEALRTEVVAATDPAGAPALRDAGIEPVDGSSVDDLVSGLDRAMRGRAIRFVADGVRVSVHGAAVTIGDRPIRLAPGPAAVLRALARCPGSIVSAAEIRAAIPAWADVDDHAVETAVHRLRAALSGLDVVQTVVRRGYRLNL